MATEQEFAEILFEDTKKRLYDEVSRTLIGADQKVVVAAVAAIFGGQAVKAVHGTSPDELQTIHKADAGQTPRTIADLRSGAVIKYLIREKFPNSRINEEETGDEVGVDEYDFHVDPLDGTSSYARELRYSTVGIAIYRANNPFASVIYHPFEEELVVAQAGKGTKLYDVFEEIRLINERQLEVSKNKLAGGVVYVDALFNEKTSSRKFGFMADLVVKANNNLGFRMSGSNIDQQLKVAAGRAEVSLTDAVGGFFDLAAGGLAITEAGGKFTDQEGNPVNEQTQIAYGSNGLVHDDLLELGRKWYQDYQGFK